MLGMMLVSGAGIAVALFGPVMLAPEPAQEERVRKPNRSSVWNFGLPSVLDGLGRCAPLESLEAVSEAGD